MEGIVLGILKLNILVLPDFNLTAPWTVERVKTLSAADSSGERRIVALAPQGGCRG